MPESLPQKITLAKSAGFCFGVNRAVNMVYSLLDENKKVCTLGPIIHNKEMVEELERAVSERWTNQGMWRKAARS